MQKPTQIVVFLDPVFYRGRPVGVENLEFLLFGGNIQCVQRLACRAISASAELFMFPFALVHLCDYCIPLLLFFII